MTQFVLLHEKGSYIHRSRWSWLDGRPFTGSELLTEDAELLRTGKGQMPCNGAGRGPRGREQQRIRREDYASNAPQPADGGCVVFVHANDTADYGDGSLEIDLIKKYFQRKYGENVYVRPFTDQPEDSVADARDGIGVPDTLTRKAKVYGRQSLLRVLDRIAEGEGFESDAALDEVLEHSTACASEEDALLILCQGYLVTHACAVGGRYIDGESWGELVGEGDRLAIALHRMGWFDFIATNAGKMDMSKFALKGPIVRTQRWWQRVFPQAPQLRAAQPNPAVSALIVAMFGRGEIEADVVAEAYLSLCGS